MNTALALALRDTTYAVWTTGEIDDLVLRAVAQLYPRYARYLDPSVAGAKITMTSNTYFYALPTGTLDVSSIDWIDTDTTTELGPLDDTAWQVVGDYRGTLKLRVSPTTVLNGGVLRVHGYARYDVTTNLITDDLVPVVLAHARIEAYQRAIATRAQSKQWIAKSQGQNISLNELLAEVQQATSEYQRLRAQSMQTFRRPVPGRLG